ncbi:hypothetical protein PC129_g18992 [Phytophthora cactorum]|uniref:Arrestin C-terminal-like domain-containing protein n=2 Tax=Phytophthora cactorum TaxID=29920 RepID=A0A8T1HDI2_9STRA|nr:hypothetical protein PC111_g19031 [Phytophthora cactorum]KAG2883016.1 hypothetical protein PC114_g20761 [Phytophthora cactorum]KAG2997149.1 hypothetical protein PC120_g21325 [Phytophthora cactorum]KAG3059264.1 hypothetical protein PC121_g14010 [Phytophthora cactorum]KAG3061096.1 hypothetical protein PC122_g19774 [Phytophthora cactorum]
MVFGFARSCVIDSPSRLASGRDGDGNAWERSVRFAFRRKSFLASLRHKFEDHGELGKAFGFSDKGRSASQSISRPILLVGTIHVAIHDTIECDALELKVAGKEKVEFTHVRHETRDGETTVHRHQIQLGNEFFKPKLVIFATSDRNYTPGRWRYRELSAKIKYKFKATLDVDGFFASDLKADCNLVIHERNFRELVPSEDSTTQNVKFLCCFNRGTCQLAVAMDKSVYFPGETAQIQCSVTNGSTVEITAMRCKLYQDITVKITKEGSYRTFTKLMCESAFPGVPPDTSLSQPQPLTLISTSNSHLQPTTKSDLTACAYRIDVECDIPWCPDIRLHLPINILAPELPNPSAGWVLEECSRSAS